MKTLFKGFNFLLFSILSIYFVMRENYDLLYDINANNSCNTVLKLEEKYILSQGLMARPSNAMGIIKIVL